MKSVTRIKPTTKMAIKSIFFGLNKAVDESESVISLVLNLVISRFLVVSIDIAMVAEKSWHYDQTLLSSVLYIFLSC